MTFTERLKFSTQSVHRETEGIMIKRLKQIASVQDYIEVLGILYGFWRPVDIAIRRYISNSLLDDIEERGNVHYITADLDALGYKNEIRLATEVPLINSFARALGALYVMEGSTLGGQHIARMLRLNETLRHYDAFRFFEGYRDRTESMWRKFQQSLNNSFPEYEEESEGVEAATETFSKFRDWLVSGNISAGIENRKTIEAHESPES